MHADPSTKLSVLKAELLKALRETHPDGTLNEHRIPKSAEDILLARPVDINDLSLGWEPLEQADEFDEELSDAKGKGKAAIGAVGKNKGKAKSAVTDSPQGAGLRDSGVVAFKFRSEEEKAKETFGGEEYENVDELGDGVLAEDRKGKWDVVVPSLEETYGEGEEQEQEVAS